MKYIAKYIKPYILIISVTLALKLAAAFFDLFLPSVLEIILDDVVPAAKLSGSHGMIYRWGAVMLLCAVGSVSFNTFANFFAARTSGLVTKSIRHDLFSKIMHFSSSQLDSFTVPSSVSRLTTDTYNVNQFLARMQRIGVRGPILLIGGIIITLTMDVKFTLILLASLPLIALLVWLVTSKSVPMYTKQQTVLDSLVAILRENITGVRVVRALSMEEHEKKRFDAVNSKLANTEMLAGALTAITSPVSTLILNLGLTAVIVVGAIRVNNGSSEVGKIIAFQSYFTIILNAMLGITRVFVMYSKADASSKRIGEILSSEDPTIRNIAQNGQKCASEDTPCIEFRNVSFSYNKVENNLENISFSLGQGQTLGIIGATGSGKSTIISLLMHFYDAGSGEIFVDGKNVNTIPDDILHKKFGAVFQNDFIASDTIAENIRFYRDVSDSDVSDAASLAQADEFICGKDGGMEYTLAVSGNDISGGQKQRLLIARAVAAKPEILILDDSSSALDYKTDAKLRRALHERLPSTSKIIVAQRISSIANADVILVLDDGRQAACGTHEALMQSCRIYRDIVCEQTGAADGGDCVGC